MDNFKNICEKFDATVLQQLYKKVTDEDGSLKDKNVFPVTLVQSIFDAITGIRLDDILSHYNYLFVQYKGSQSSTRLTIPIAHRRKSLIISYVNYNNDVIIEQYVGDTINDEDWSSDNNWKAPFTDGNFIVSPTDEQLDASIIKYFDSKDLDSIITNSIRESVKEYINSEDGKSVFIDGIQDSTFKYFEATLNHDVLKEIVYEVINDRMNDILLEYLKSDEGRELIKDIITPDLEETVGEYFTAVKKYLEDNERVIANALARHEQAITDLQNK